ncbi:MAG: hypothetical protein ACRDNK_17770 [Solirubrobacteraceae bacterium]
MFTPARIRRLLHALAAGCAAAVTHAGTALALPVAASGDVAKNLADQLSHWAGLILVPAAAIVALPALFRHDVGHAFVVLLIVLVIGMFAFDAVGVQTLVTTVANTVLG